MFRVIWFSGVAIVATLLSFTANAEELRPSKLRPYGLGSDGSLVVAGSPVPSVQATAPYLLELCRRSTGISGAPAKIGGNSELVQPKWEEVLKSLAEKAPREFLILSGVSQDKIDSMVIAALSLIDGNNPKQFQRLVDGKIVESENAKDWKRMALFQYLYEELDSKVSNQKRRTE